MIIRTEDELFALEPGTEVFWTTLYDGAPIGVESAVIAYRTTNSRHFPELYGPNGSATKRGTSETTRFANLFVPEGARSRHRVHYFNTLLQKQRVCATTRAEAEEGLESLKLLWRTGCLK